MSKEEEKSNLKKFFPSAESACLHASATCNLECSYCYILKTDSVVEMQKNVIDQITSGRWIQQLKECYGEGLTSLSFWGGEPTIGMHKYIPTLDEALKTFPNLKTFHYSTNLMTNWEVNQIGFFRALDEALIKADRKANVDMQLSLDGPPEITDKNRIGGATDKIIENCINIFKDLKNKPTKNLTITSHFKPTWSHEQIAEAANNLSFLDNQISFMGRNNIQIKRKYKSRKRLYAQIHRIFNASNSCSSWRIYN
jgi:sulfatase maturation enzyme AslB (radical SAM superfamily)